MKSSPIQKGAYIKEIQVPGTNFTGIFTVTNVSRLLTRDKKPYWAFTIADSTGRMGAHIWSRDGITLEPNELGSEILAEISGYVKPPYKGEVKVSVDRLTPLSPEEVTGLPLDAFIEPSPYDGDAAFAKLCKEAEQEFTYGPWLRLFHSFFDEGNNAVLFRNASAAQSMHHSGAGGLAVHTWEVFSICQSMAGLFPDLDRQTLLAGALFHDIGKLREMNHGIFGTSYTTEGNLLGHMLLGMEMLEPFCQKAGLPEALKRHLFHLIASHHGKLEYGAIKTPATQEAMTLHLADMMSSKLNPMAMNTKEAEEDTIVGKKGDWGWALYRPMKTPDGKNSGNPVETLGLSDDGCVETATIADSPLPDPAGQPASSPAPRKRGRKPKAVPSQADMAVPDIPSWMNDDIPIPDEIPVQEDGADCLEPFHCPSEEPVQPESFPAPVSPEREEMTPESDIPDYPPWEDAPAAEPVAASPVPAPPSGAAVAKDGAETAPPPASSAESVSVPKRTRKPRAKNADRTPDRKRGEAQEKDDHPEAKMKEGSLFSF